MKYPYTVKYNGKYYPPGKDVPEKQEIKNDGKADVSLPEDDKPKRQPARRGPSTDDSD